MCSGAACQARGGPWQARVGLDGAGRIQPFRRTFSHELMFYTKILYNYIAPLRASLQRRGGPWPAPRADSLGVKNSLGEDTGVMSCILRRCIVGSGGALRCDGSLRFVNIWRIMSCVWCTDSCSLSLPLPSPSRRCISAFCSPASTLAHTLRTPCGRLLRQSMDPGSRRFDHWKYGGRRIFLCVRF